MRFSARRVMLTATAVLLVVPLLGLSAAPGSADAIADKKAQATQIAQQLDQLGAQIDQLGQQYDAAQQKLEQVNGQIDAAGRQLASSNRQLAQARKDLAAYAVEAYVRGGESDLPEVLLTGTGPDVVRQVEYLKAASGNRTQLIDDVRAAEYATKSQLASLQASQAAAKALQTKLQQQKDQAGKAISQQQALQATVTGQLAQLVAQAQAARAALAAQQAKARLAQPAPTGSGTKPGKPGSPTTTLPGTPPTTSPPGDDPVIPLPIPPGTPPPVLPAAVKAIAVARQFLGQPYVWGGNSPSTGFDCSGLVQYAYGQVGLSLPRVADQQAAATRHVSYADAQAGDLVFFDSPDVGHVGIYLGNGMMLDAPHSGAVIRIEAIWRSTLVGFGRIV